MDDQSTLTRVKDDDQDQRPQIKAQGSEVFPSLSYSMMSFQQPFAYKIVSAWGGGPTQFRNGVVRFKRHEKKTGISCQPCLVTAGGVHNSEGLTAIHCNVCTTSDVVSVPTSSLFVTIETWPTIQSGQFDVKFALALNLA